MARKARDSVKFNKGCDISPDDFNNYCPKPVRIPESNERRTRQHVTDWKAIENEKEKYAAYLCSREWAEKREAVRKRANGRCERCLVFDMDACHHLTYERKYNEDLKDLQAICNLCHEFTHGKSDDDPARWSCRIRRYLSNVLRYKPGKYPCPPAILLGSRCCLVDRLSEAVKAIEILECAVGSVGPWSPVEILNDTLPFDFRLFLLCGGMHGAIDSYEYCCSVEYFFGHKNPRICEEWWRAMGDDE